MRRQTDSPCGCPSANPPGWGICRASAGGKGCEDVVGVRVGLDATHDLGDRPVWRDDERRSIHAEVLPARKALLAPHAVPLRYLVLRVGEKSEGQVVLALELG